MFKWIALAIAVAYGGWWYFHSSRVMDEKMIEDQYQRESMALARFDAAFLCNQLADDYRGTGIRFTLSGTQRFAKTKAETCTDVEAGLKQIKRVMTLSDGKFMPQYDNKIVDITLSPDRKSVTVQGIGSFYLSGRLVARSQFHDTLIRRMGRLRHAVSESQERVFIPAQ